MPDSYVLIHGSWHGGWCWRPVAARLRAAGHRVLTPTLPGLADGDDPTAYGFDDVIDSVAELVEREDLSDVVLVGHSSGGYVVTGAAPRLRPRLKTIVYWSAFVPAEGVPLMGEVPPEVQHMFEVSAAESGENAVTLPYEMWRQVFIQDASEDVRRITHSLLVPHPHQYNKAVVAPLDAEALGVPVTYLLGSDDMTMPPGDDGWRAHAARLGLTPVEIPGSHEGMFTQPQAVADALLNV